MNFSFKDLRFIIEAIDCQINVYQERLQDIENVDEDEDEAADLGNDIKFLEILRTDIANIIEQKKSIESFNYSEITHREKSSENSEDFSFQVLVKLALKLSIHERLALVDAITESLRKELAIN